jgi:hypothetical protein
MWGIVAGPAVHNPVAYGSYCIMANLGGKPFFKDFCGFGVVGCGNRRNALSGYELGRAQADILDHRLLHSLGSVLRLEQTKLNT